jgi:hypothetical protein
MLGLEAGEPARCRVLVLMSDPTGVIQPPLLASAPPKQGQSRRPVPRRPRLPLSDTTGHAVPASDAADRGRHGVSCRARLLDALSGRAGVLAGSHQQRPHDRRGSRGRIRRGRAIKPCAPPSDFTVIAEAAAATAAASDAGQPAKIERTPPVTLSTELL